MSRYFSALSVIKNTSKVWNINLIYLSSITNNVSTEQNCLFREKFTLIKMDADFLSTKYLKDFSENCIGTVLTILESSLTFAYSCTSLCWLTT